MWPIRLDRAAQWPETRLVSAYVFGVLLAGEADLAHVQLAFVVAEPAESVPWMAQPAHLEALAATLRLTKLPLSWRWRPEPWPVWNDEIDRAVRFWTKDAGRDPGVLGALAARTFGELTIEGPTAPGDLHDQLVVERDIGRRHLAAVTESFHDQDWRRAHRGGGVYPEDHLWRATAAFLQLDDAIGQLEE